MSENREKREEQIQRLAESLAKAEAYNDPAWWRATAARLYDAGARIPDPPTPAAPEVVVTREADDAAMGAWRRDGFMATWSGAADDRATMRASLGSASATKVQLLTARHAVRLEALISLMRTLSFLHGWPVPTSTPYNMRCSMP